jgi:hypothetical protein
MQVDRGHACSFLFSSKLRRVAGKNKVAIFAGLAARKAGLVQCLVVGFAISKLSGFFIGPTRMRAS